MERTPLTEDELRAAEREVLERERAVMEKEKRLAETQEANRVDYLFEKINRDNRKMVIEVPQPVIIHRTNNLDAMTAAAAIIAAVMGIAIFIVTLI